MEWAGLDGSRRQDSKADERDSDADGSNCWELLEIAGSCFWRVEESSKIVDSGVQGRRSSNAPGRETSAQ
jgi:hypothetical protein